MYDIESPGGQREAGQAGSLMLGADMSLCWPSYLCLFSGHTSALEPPAASLTLHSHLWQECGRVTVEVAWNLTP